MKFHQFQALFELNIISSSLCNYTNPLSPNSVQQQFSPNNIHTLSRDKVMRINKMIIIEKIPWSFTKFSQLILKGNVWRSVWRICMWILGLKGLISSVWDYFLEFSWRQPPPVSHHFVVQQMWSLTRELTVSNKIKGGPNVNP